MRVLLCQSHLALNVETSDNGLEQTGQAPKLHAGAVGKQGQGFEQRAKCWCHFFQCPVVISIQESNSVSAEGLRQSIKKKET